MASGDVLVAPRVAPATDVDMRGDDPAASPRKPSGRPMRARRSNSRYASEDAQLAPAASVPTVEGAIPVVAHVGASLVAETAATVEEPLEQAEPSPRRTPQRPTPRTTPRTKSRASPSAAAQDTPTASQAPEPSEPLHVTQPQAPVVAVAEGVSSASDEVQKYARLTAGGVWWCRYCGSCETSQWRRGPWGANTLCNKCGCRYLGLGCAPGTGKNVKLNLAAYETEALADRALPLMIEFPDRFTYRPKETAPGARPARLPKEPKRLKKGASKTGLSVAKKAPRPVRTPPKAPAPKKKEAPKPQSQPKEKASPKRKKAPPRPPPPPPFVIPETASGCARSEGLIRYNAWQKKSFVFPARFPRTVDPPPESEIREAQEASTRGGIIGDMSRWKRMLERRHTLVIDKSRIHGWGLFTTVALEKDDIVLEYTGQIVRQSVADKREAEYERQMGMGTHYLWRIDDDRIVDATIMGNEARLINHSCDPNCFARVVSIEGKKKVAICALRPIRPGEELCYDYKFDIEGDDAKIPCGCGTAKCRGALNS